MIHFDITKLKPEHQVKSVEREKKGGFMALKFRGERQTPSGVSA